MLGQSSGRGLGPEIDDDNVPLHASGGAPLSQRQQQDAMADASVARGQQYTGGGAIRGGEAKRATSEVEVEMWKLGLNIGSRLDVKDTVDKWCEAEVLAVDREAAKVLITYIFWAEKVCDVLWCSTGGGASVGETPVMRRTYSTQTDFQLPSQCM